MLKFVGAISFLLLGFLLLPPNTASAADKSSIIFFQESYDLSVNATAILDETLKQYRNSNKRFEIKAYAALANKPSWSAFRLSLERALAVRDYLLRHNVPHKDIILMPQGNVCEAPCQRVDISLK